MAARRVFSTTGDVAIQILRLTAASADAFPPLKSAAGTALCIAEIVQKFGSNKAEWREFGSYLQDATGSVVESTSRLNATTEDVGKRLESLRETLVEIAGEIEAERTLPAYKRVISFMRDPELIAGMRKRVDDIIGLFQLSAAITNMIDIKKILDAVEANSRGLSDFTQHVVLDKLRRVPGATWDSSRVCLERTRVKLINDILTWINHPDDSSSSTTITGATIMLLTGVAGAGKTTIAHTIARRCAEDKQLGSCFFFDQETEGRNSSVALFTTFASDLSRLDKRIAQRIVAAIEEDRSLPTAPMSTQFDELVLKPCQGVPITRPVAIVIDALDEAWDDALLDILYKRAGGLPRAFRIFITSRMRPELDILCRANNVQRKELDIAGQANMDDMAEYVAYKLRELADRRDLGAWPNEELRVSFTTKAGGLFLWVATVCDYLRNRDDPTEELQRLMSGVHTAHNTSAESQMDRLYATILESYDWTDDGFVAAYGRVMGAAISSKTPLTVSALRELYHGQPLASDFTLQRLSPLLTGMSKAEHGSQPVRVLHQSLRDFLVIRSGSVLAYSRFILDEIAKSGELAVLCLNILDRSLNQTIPIAGYLSKNSENEGVPTMDAEAISEALRYACRFWPDHVCDVDNTSDVEEALLNFMENDIVGWLEVMACYRWCRELVEVCEWMEKKMSTETLSRIRGFSKKYADACWILSSYLDYDDRREEALTVTMESVRIYRQLAVDHEEMHLSNLAIQTNNLAQCFSALGWYEQALASAKDAVELRRKLAINQPDTVALGLSASLQLVSTCFSDIGQFQEALPPIQEAVKLRRKLADDQPALYAAYLAKSLHNLSFCLSNVGRQVDALPITREVVELRRHLAATLPATHMSSLANSLLNLHTDLDELGRYEEGLLAIQESVQIREKLAAERPAVYSQGLAESLYNLSCGLSRVGRHTEALGVTERAVELFRKLAQDRPELHMPNLARCLSNLSYDLGQQGRRIGAIKALEESTEIYRRLAQARPTIYKTHLKDDLREFSRLLGAMSRDAEALAASHEADEL